MKPSSTLLKPALCLFLACAWSGCDRKPDAASQSAAPAAGSPAAASSAPASAPAAPASGLVTNAERIGMAGRMPKDTAFYIGSANMKAHREALEKTQYWQTLLAFQQDSKPSADKPEKKEKKKALARVDDLKIDDFFMAMGKNSASGVKWLRDLNHVYNEYTYRTLMTGFAGGAGGAAGSFNPETIMANAASSPEMIERICAVLERAELLPVMMGLKTAQAEDLMKQMFPADPKDRPEWVAALKEGSLTLGSGKLTTFEGTFGVWLTAEVRAKWLEGIGKSVQQEAVLTRIKATLDTLAAKKFSVAFGVSEGYLIVAGGNDLSHVRFAASPAESLLARPDLAMAEPHAAKNLLGLFHMDGDFLTGVYDDQPLTPMLQAALGGLAGTPMFAELTQKLEPKVATLATAEKAFYKRTFTHANGIFWWEKGLNFEMAGGVTPEGLMLDKPLQFASLLEAPDVIFAAVGHSAASVTGRAYFEGWMDLLYTAAGGLVQSGLGGDQALATYGLVEKGVIPPLVKIYNASKTLYQKGVGSESALVVDLKGHTPLLPGAADSPEAVGGAIPRITAVHTVVDRKAISDAWTVIGENLNLMLQSSPMPVPPMTPMSSEKDGLTTWFYPLAPGGNDLLPCVTLNDKLFMLGTSMNQHGELAAALKKPAATPLTGAHYRFSFAPIRTLLKTAGAVPIPGAAAEDVSKGLPFIAPFGDFRGRAWVEGGQLRNTFHLEVNDVRQVD